MDPNVIYEYVYRNSTFGIAIPSSMQRLTDLHPHQLRKKNALNNRPISKQCGPQSAASSSNFSWRMEKATKNYYEFLPLGQEFESEKFACPKKSLVNYNDYVSDGL